MSWNGRIGLGPVFAMEWLTTSRKWQVYALRALFVGALLAATSLVWAESRFTSAPTRRQLAQLGAGLFVAMATVQLALVMLAAPAATAGALCLDKARGTLLHLLVTDLSDAEIVLGKLAARLVPALGLVLCALPVAASLTLLGGVDPVALTGLFLVTLGLAAFGCALALLFSVWARKTHEVVMTVYLVWVAWLLAWPVMMWLDWMVRWNLLGLRRGGPPRGWLRPDGLFAKANPVWITFGPMEGSRMGLPGFADQVGFTAVMLGLASLCATVAAVLMRRVTIRQSGQVAVARSWWRWLPIPRLRRLGFRTSWLPAPGLDGNPVLWREWHGNRARGWSRRIWAVYAVASIAASGLVVAAALIKGRTDEGAAVVNCFQVGVGLLLLSVSASTSLAEERVRGSLDVLMTTPLSTAQIVWGKWLGAFRRVPWLAILPTVTVSAAALVSNRGSLVIPPLVLGSVLVHGAVITAFGLLMAVWTPRLGRAVACTVAAYVLVGVGWLFLLVLTNPGGPDNVIVPAMASPPFAHGMLGAMAEDHGSGRDWGRAVFGGIFWIVAYTAITAGLLAVAWGMAPRFLGRIDHGTFRDIREAMPKPRKARRPADEEPFAAEAVDAEVFSR